MRVKPMALMDLERWEEAESMCEKGLEADPGNEYLLQCVDRCPIKY